MNDLTQEELERLLWSIDRFGYTNVAPQAGALIIPALKELRQRRVEEKMVKEMDR